MIISICIATRNRGAFIGATLESIVTQANDAVEIVVLDGASSDNTEEVVRLYQKRFPHLRYFRQDTNRGIDRDFANAVDLAQGEYCWLFSDDDVLKPGAIQIVLDALQVSYPLIIVNSEVRSADLRTVLESKRLPFKENRLYKSCENDRLLIEVANYLTFIGCVVIKRALWNARKKEDYFGSCFIHVGVIFQQALPGDALVIARPLILIRYANASWLGRYFEIWMFKWPNLIWSFVAFPGPIKLRVCRKEPWRSPRTLLHLRGKGAYTKEEYGQWLRPRLSSKWARAIAKATAYMPGRVANFIVFIYYSAFNRASDRSLFLLDLANSPFCFWKLPRRRNSVS
jgi:glycosyltransferase involved in cell wall biosynthesis